MKIVVLNRMHLDEWPSDEVEAALAAFSGHPVIKCFSRRPLPAGTPPRRGHDENITMCFPGDPNGNRDQRDARHITKLCQGSDLVLDIHGWNHEEGDFPFYGLSSRGSPLVMGVASLLGSRHALLHKSPHPAGTLPNYVAWELSPSTTVLGQLRSWLEALAGGWVPQALCMQEYHYAGYVDQADARPLGLWRDHGIFGRLPDEGVLALGLRPPLHALAWDLSYTNGEVATPVE
jgi:hypothetical protein